MGAPSTTAIRAPRGVDRSRPGTLNLNKGQQTKNPPPGGRPKGDDYAAFRPTFPRSFVGPLAPLATNPGKSYCDRTGLWVVWRCPSSGRVVRTASPCARLDCATCYPHLKARRGRRLYSRFGKVPLGAFVFTLPRELRATVGLEQAAELRRMLAELVQGWAFDRWRVRIGVVVCFHPTGDRCARCGWSRRSKGDGEPIGVTGKCPRCSAPAQWEPHFDVLVPLLGIAQDLKAVRDDGSIEVAGTLRSLPFHFAPRREGELAPELVDIRRRWSELVLQVADAAGARLSRTMTVVDKWGDARERIGTRERLERGEAVIDYGFMLTERRKLHRYGYSARPFPAFANPDRGIGRLRTYQGFGLAGPHATGPGVEEWRAAVAVPETKRALLCDCCADRKELVPIDVVRDFTARFRLWMWARLHSSCGPPPDGAPRPSSPSSGANVTPLSTHDATL